MHDLDGRSAPDITSDSTSSSRPTGIALLPDRLRGHGLGSAPSWVRHRLLLGLLCGHATAIGALSVAHAAGAAPLDVQEVFQHPLMWAAVQCAFLVALASTHLLARQLRERRFVDSVTNLPNRSLFEIRLGQVVRRVSRDRRCPHGPAVLFIDLDDFKSVNDNLGHAAGDQLLSAVGQRIRASTRPADLLARVGGDEFAVLLPDTSATAASAVADRIVAVLGEPFEISTRRVVIGCSVGITMFNGSQEAGDLLREADTAMYAAKREGKGRHRSFRTTMERTPENQVMVRSELEIALREGQLRVHYQPVISTATSTVVAVEALVRWDHPQDGLRLPNHFVPHAESSALIAAIDRWVLAEACTQVRRWNQLRTELQPPIAVGVNVSAHHLLLDDFYDAVERILRETGLDPTLLLLEVTETALMTDPDAAANVLSRIRALGAKVAIDDFGTGQSSLGHLRVLPLDVIKIDRSFIQPIGGRIEDEAIVRAVTKLGHDLGLRVVAEGVETPLQLVRVEEIGCDLVQGYMFSAPLAASEAWAFLAHDGVGSSGRVARTSRLCS